MVCETSLFNCETGVVSGNPIVDLFTGFTELICIALLVMAKFTSEIKISYLI